MRSRLAALLFGVLLVLVVGELLGRALGPGPRPPGPPSVNWAGWVHDPELGFVCRPDLDFVNHAVRALPRVRTDAHGLRRGGPGGAPRLLVVGDSTAFAAEVEDDETPPARLGAAMGWPVANAAVRGYSTVQSLGMLRRQLARLEGIEAVLYVLTTNDVAENLAPEAAAPAPRLVPEGGAFRVVALTGSAAPGTPVAAGRDAGWRWQWRTRAALVDFAIDAGRVLTAAGAPAPAGVRTPESGPGATRSRPPGAESGTAALPGAPPGDDLREPALAWALAEMVTACQSRSVPLVVTVFPGTPPAVQAALVPRAGSFRALVEAAGATFVAVPEDFPYLDPALRARRPWVGYDPHFGAEGTRRWAEALLPALGAALRRPGGGSPGPAGSG